MKDYKAMMKEIDTTQDQQPTKRKIHLVADCSTSERVDRRQLIKLALTEAGNDVTMSAEHSYVKSNMRDESNRQHVFDQDIQNLNECDLLFIVVNEDGTAPTWEAGFCYGVRENTIDHPYGFALPVIVSYCDKLTEVDCFDVLLERCSDIVLHDFEEIKTLDKLLVNFAKHRC